MMSTDLLGSLAWIVVGAAVFALLGRALLLPSIVAYLIVGLLLGPVIGVVQPTPALKSLSEIGVALLLFLVGLELSFDKLRAVGKVALVAGLGQVVFTAVGGIGLCLILGFNFMESLFLSVALTFSSTVVVVKILGDKNELDSLYGRIAVGIFLVQDLVVVLVLTVLTGLQGLPEAGSAEAGIWPVAMSIAKAFGGTALLLALAVAASRFLLPRPFSWAAKSPAVAFVWSLGWCFGMVGLAHQLDLSIELGAFFAGLSLAQLPNNRDLQHRVRPLMNIFVAVFFVTLGLGISPQEGLAEWPTILVLSLFVLIGNPIIFFLIIAAMGYSRRDAFLSGVTVAQISEFSFIFVAMGVASGLVGSRVASITAVVGILTIAVSAYLILYNRPLYRAFARWLGWQESPGRDEESPRAGHILVIGMNSLGKRIVRELHGKGCQVLAVDTDARKLRHLPCETLLGSTEFLDVLLDAGLPRARLLISALRIEEANELLAYRCRQFGIPCCVHAVDLSVVDNLLELDVNYLILSKVDGVKLQNQRLCEMGLLPA